MSLFELGVVAAGAVFVALSVAVMVVYNLLTRRVALMEEAWSNVVVALVRRRDALPSLSATIAGALHHELTTQELAASRAAHAPLVARDEVLPTLTAVPLARRAQRELVAIEDDIQGTRLIFNRAVARYNRLVLALPTSLVARAAGFATAPYFEADSLLAVVRFSAADGADDSAP